MSYKIAVAGKGGTGKTTISAIILARMIARGCRPVLAVDADPNSCLDAALGVTVSSTVGRAREDLKAIVKSGSETGLTKQQMLEMKITESLVEEDAFDLIAMGQPEGEGCYCYANMVLKQILTEMTDAYPYVVIDNEAGLENLSRRIVPHVDFMVLVTDPSKQGIRTIERLHTLARKMQITWDRLAVVVNRVRGDDIPAAAREVGTRIEPDSLIAVPDSVDVGIFAEQGKPLTDLDTANPAVQRIDDLLKDALPHASAVHE